MDKKHSLWKTILACCLIFSVLASCALMYLKHQSAHEHQHLVMENQAAQMQDNVESAMSTVYSLRALVLGANGGDLKLSQWGSVLLQPEYADYVRNLLLAPDGVAAQVYPLEGNESVLGLDLYSTQNKTNQDALLANTSDAVIVTGPYTLVQGGQAISGRLRVTMADENGAMKSWGLVSVTLDFPNAMLAGGSDLLAEDGSCYQVSSWTDNGWSPIYSHDYEDGQHCETMEFSIYTMRFQLSAYPASGWIGWKDTLLLVLGVFLVTFLLGSLLHLFVVERDALRQRAAFDALTGLYNRASGVAKINHLLKTTPFGALLLLDVDHFKQVNDLLGHQTGDELLTGVAAAISSVFRTTDIAMRLGGDEFIVFLPCNAPADFWNEKVKLLLKAVRRTITRGGQSVNVTASIGVALYPQDGASFDTLYAKADKALYQAKENGRDGACCLSNNKED